MAANTISQISTANTFQHWLTATQSLIGVANNLTNGNGSTFYANTRLEIGGTGASLNVVTGATINEQYSNTINTVNLVVTQNIAQANITNTLKVGNDAVVYDTLTVFGNTTLNTNLEVVGTANITGDLNVSGNINLDSIGFDDLNVAGSGSFGNTLNVTGATTISTLDGVSANLSTNVSVLHTTTTDNLVANTINVTNQTVTGELVANIFTGNANTAIFAAIAQAQGDSLAFSIALG
jgi:hypothetical protein